MNVNKMTCGSIHLNNNLYIKIENSKFKENYSTGDGGAL